MKQKHKDKLAILGGIVLIAFILGVVIWSIESAVSCHADGGVWVSNTIGFDRCVERLDR